MTLIENMTALNARLQAIPIRFGVPQHRQVLIRHSVLDDALLPVVTDTLIEPLPIVENVPLRLIGLDLTGGVGQSATKTPIVISKEDYMISGIPRTYAREFLEVNVQFLCIDPTLDEDGVPILDSLGNPTGGVMGKAVHVSDKELLTWKIIFRKMRDRYAGNGITEVLY